MHAGMRDLVGSATFSACLSVLAAVFITALPKFSMVYAKLGRRLLVSPIV